MYKQAMYTRTMGMVNSLASTMDPDFMESHLQSALQRYRDTQAGFLAASYEREAQVGGCGGASGALWCAHAHTVTFELAAIDLLAVLVLCMHLSAMCSC